MADFCRVHLIENRIVDYADLNGLLVDQGKGNTRVGKGVDKIHGPINRIDDPGGFIGELQLLSSSHRLFPNESIKGAIKMLVRMHHSTSLEYV